MSIKRQQAQPDNIQNLQKSKQSQDQIKAPGRPQPVKNAEKEIEVLG